MTKDKLIDMLKSPLATDEEKRVADKIEATLYCFGGGVEIDGLDSIERFERYGGFNRSRTDAPEGTVLKDLEDILAQARVWVKRQCYVEYGNAADRMNATTKVFLNIFLAIIAVFAISAVIFMILHFCLGDKFLGGRGDDVAEAFGVLDFALGALGFIVERKDDMSKRAKLGKMENAIEAGDTERFASIVNQVKQKAGKNSVLIVGNGNTVNNTEVEHSFHHVKIEDNRRYGDKK